MILTENDSKQLNDMENFLSWKSSWIFKQFVTCTHKIIGLFTGNQYGKTASVSYQYVLRIMGIHPVPDKNVLYFECASRYCPNGHRHTDIPDNKLCHCGEEIDDFSGHKYSIKTRPENNVCHCGERITIHKRKTRIFRFCAETLPGDKGDTGNKSESSETRNTVYPAFKKWLPAFLIKKDITARVPSMIIRDINSGRVFGTYENGEPMIYEGGDIVVEFVSYSQEAQATAGVQRLSIWTDEEPRYEFYKEQFPRLFAENGDFIISLTPANYITWTYDEIFEKGRDYFRSKAICDFLNNNGDDCKQIESTDSPLNIAIFQAATDDNPTLSKSVINEMIQIYDDPDDVAIRRYGIFRQVSGRIFKDFDYNTHIIDEDKYFPEGMPGSYTFARGIDYHAQTPWACGFIMLSPENEAFIIDELTISPEKYTTKEICHEIALKSKDYNFRLNLIDPYSESCKKDGISVLTDINREFLNLRQENIGNGGYWQTWDTKGEKGRDEIKMRLKNSKKVGRPFNNRVIENGREVLLPTIWIFKKCKTSQQCLKQWRWEEWAKVSDRNSKDAKNTPQQKYSHMNMVWEACFKHPAFKPQIRREHVERQYRYMQGRC